MTENDTENGREQESKEHAGTYPDSVPDEWARTLRVTVESDEQSDEGGTDHPTLSFPDVDTATAVFTDSTLALLRALNVHEPASIREAARLVDRDKKNVHDQLRKLAAHGIVEFAQEGNAKRPIVAYDEIVFDFSVSLESERDHTDEPAAA
ncbi:helix-turn-helix domain-containing protein (plasmid) [Halococcus dombrowskii]|uniref:Helix-turn-helix domain-containing protein n=1 Tax=Halococcus dombrowskii TaxID=179637 RepID=A0AAV3SLH5_HALDO|nr:helix-turn-helix domain-containing protein [Halococcus dombrowskii]UOO96905.1 helix-turn-helix domain-containing protein [Halococcus dombrowskii]